MASEALLSWAHGGTALPHAVLTVQPNAFKNMYVKIYIIVVKLQFKFNQLKIYF